MVESTPERPGRPRSPLDRDRLDPAVVGWAEYLRGLVDSAGFTKDADAAGALGIDAPDL